MSFDLVLLRTEGKPETYICEGWPEDLKAEIPGITVHFARSPEEARPHLTQADAAFGWIDADLFPLAGHLRWLACPQVGPHPSYFHEALVNSDVVVTNVRGIFNDHISAHIMAYVLAFARGLHVYIERQSRREWRPDYETVHLPQSTAVIVGLGGIGVETARVCVAFGMTVIGVDPRIEEPPPGVAELYRPDAMTAAVARGDFVIVTVPQTPATEGLFDAALFQAMKPTAFFINIGRGATTNLADLDAALRSGVIAGAGLDVYEQEPLPQDHPLWSAPGALLTPHVAAIGPYLDDRRREVFFENCRRFATGRPLMNVVDKPNWF